MLDGSRQSAYLKEKPPKQLLYEDAFTLYQGVRRGAKISRNSPMLGARVRQADGSEPHMWQTYNQILKRADNIALGFREVSLYETMSTLVTMQGTGRNGSL